MTNDPGPEGEGRWLTQAGRESIPQLKPQLSKVCALLERHLGPSLIAVHLFGSAVEGGLRPLSDIDLLVTVRAPLHEGGTWLALAQELLTCSVPPGTDPVLRALEVTVVALTEISSGRYPLRREFQFGEWLRESIAAGRIEPPMADADLALLLNQAHEHSLPLWGPAAKQLFAPIPARHFREALMQALSLWNQPADWAGDERNIVLTLARIWYSAATGGIVSKDVAAHWVSASLPAEARAVLEEARAAYLGQRADTLGTRPDAVEGAILTCKREIERLLSR